GRYRKSQRCSEPAQTAYAGRRLPLSPLDLFSWYEVPLKECFEDGTSFPAPLTHKIAALRSLKVPLRFDPGFDPLRSDFLLRMLERCGHFEGALTNVNGGYCYGCMGLEDRRKVRLLRHGSVVLLDTAATEMDDVFR